MITIKQSESLFAAGQSRLAGAILVLFLILAAFLAIQDVGASSDPIQRGVDAASARWQAWGDYYQGQEEAAIQRGLDAASARYQALGQSYLAETGDELPYTDVSRFYVERLRAQIQGSSALADSELAANPELVLARRAYRTPASLVAANPELSIARRSYSAAANVLALNPELGAARRSYSPALSACVADGLEQAADPEFAMLRQSC